MNTRTLYFMTRIALVAMFAMGLLLVPTFNSTGTVAAQKANRQVATTEMLSYALDLRSVTDVAVYGENGVSDKGNSTVANGYRSEGAQKNDNRKDLNKSFDAINQLPCSDVADTDLSGKTFGAGVYCMASAELAGRMILDANNDPNAIFVFRIAGGLNTKSGSGISLLNDAQASSVFFVSSDSVRVGENTSFKGSIIARGSITVEGGAAVDGRVLSVKGDVALNGNLLGPEQTGILEICKAVDATTGGLANRIFQFRIGALIAEVPAGQCSGPLTVPSGPIVIEELLTGRIVGGGTFNGNFQLTSVITLGQTPTTAITSVNLPLRTANVTIRAGDITNQTRLQFTNQFAILAIVEICKEALDSGVTGFFNFTIAESRDGAGNLIVYTAPVGQCTGPIGVVVASDGVTAVRPRTGIVNITELAVTNVIFAGATTAPGTPPITDRFISVNLATRTLTARVVEGGVETQTTGFFFNRSLAQIKVCKIAGPGITELSVFNFTVTGFQPTFAPGTNGVDPGVLTSQNVSVLAGPVANGGFCQIATGFFLTDSTAQVTELPAVANFGEVRVSRIRSSSGIVSPVIRASGVAFFPLTGGVNTGTAATRTVIVPVQREVTEVEFVNIAFFPVPLKICKVAGTGVAVNTPFTFDVVSDTAGGLLAPFTSSVTVLAGPVANGQNGFCDFISGPFTNPSINGLTSFNFGSNVTVTERATAGVVTSSVTSPNVGNGFIGNTTNRTGQITNMINGVNEIQFINSAAAAGTPIKPRKRVRFF